MRAGALLHEELSDQLQHNLGRRLYRSGDGRAEPHRHGVMFPHFTGLAADEENVPGQLP